MCRAYQYQKIVRTTSTRIKNALGNSASDGVNFFVNCRDALSGHKQRKYYIHRHSSVQHLLSFIQNKQRPEGYLRFPSYGQSSTFVAYTQQ